jgi:hypothetical protein
MNVHSCKFRSFVKHISGKNKDKMEGFILKINLNLINE